MLLFIAETLFLTVCQSNGESGEAYSVETCPTDASCLLVEESGKKLVTCAPSSEELCNESCSVACNIVPKPFTYYKQDYKVDGTIDGLVQPIIGNWSCPLKKAKKSDELSKLTLDLPPRAVRCESSIKVRDYKTEIRMTCPSGAECTTGLDTSSELVTAANIKSEFLAKSGIAKAYKKMNSTEQAAVEAEIDAQIAKVSFCAVVKQQSHCSEVCSGICTQAKPGSMGYIYKNYESEIFGNQIEAKFPIAYICESGKAKNPAETKGLGAHYGSIGIALAVIFVAFVGCFVGEQMIKRKSSPKPEATREVVVAAKAE